MNMYVPCLLEPSVHGDALQEVQAKMLSQTIGWGDGRVDLDLGQASHR